MVDGNYTGTTDEILQWVACKWGVDEDVVRAQAAVESWWNQTNLGDWSPNSAVCAPNHPIGSDPGHPGQCPESVGILQVRYQYWSNGFPQVETSTAYNADYMYAGWRACYDGDDTWLDTVDHVGTYKPGDLWGCVGLWFSGRWHTSAAEGYITKVRGYLNSRIWTQPQFSQAAGGSPPPLSTGPMAAPTAQELSVLRLGRLRCARHRTSSRLGPSRVASIRWCKRRRA